MANLRDKILAAIDVQAAHEGETDNIKACRIIARHVKTDREWDALVSTQHHRYGALSYETHRFYYVREWVGPLVAELNFASATQRDHFGPWISVESEIVS